MLTEKQVLNKSIVLLVFITATGAWQELKSLWDKVAIIPFYQ